ncbi:hypothetical protein [Pseudomonas salomonii]|uniref:Uncharacterized protein n=1 Tax=Pseudomonas salomonii TaxID=191391 RepID=A0A1H3UZR8_9PSED|nr:hypothetical protein [Pseudomonas salomonii]SDZ67932.1 hypothetical protein SAMN05216247_11968 [Pseudomonas salomonii]
MDFTPIIAQIWGMPSQFTPAILMLALLKSPCSKGDTGDLLMRFHGCWQLNKQTHHPTAEWQCLKFGSPLLVRDVKSGVKAGPLFWGCPTILRTPPYINFDLQGSTSMCGLHAIISLKKIKSALINLKTDNTNAYGKHDLYEPGVFALTLFLISSILS